MDHQGPISVTVSTLGVSTIFYLVGRSQREPRPVKRYGLAWTLGVVISTTVISLWMSGNLTTAEALASFAGLALLLYVLVDTQKLRSK